MSRTEGDGNANDGMARMAQQIELTAQASSDSMYVE